MGTYKAGLLVSMLLALGLTGCGASSVDPVFSPVAGNTVQLNAYNAMPDAVTYMHASYPTPTASGTPVASNPTPTGTPIAGNPTPTGTPIAGNPTPTGTPIAGNPTPTGTPIAGNPTPTGTPIAGNPTPTGTPIAGNPTPTGTPIAGNPTPTGTPVAENRTVIELLTPSIVNNAANQILKFKVSYLGPSGNPVDFPLDEVLFDLAAICPEGAPSLPYTVAVSNSLEFEGSIDPVWGTDLFGNAGSNYYHYETDQAIDIAAGVTSFIFSVDLSYTIHHPYGSNLKKVPAQESIDVYVRFGHDSLYATVPVTFINP